MSIEMRYFGYHFWQTRIRLVIMSVLAILYFSQLAEIGADILSLDSMVTAGAILALYIPILEFRMFNTRRNLDTWFSLPIDRWKMALVHVLNGALHIAVVLAIGMIFEGMHVSTNAPSYNIFQLFVYYITILALTLLAYGFFCFVFTQGNSTTDGTLFIFDYLLLPGVFNGIFLNRFYDSSPRYFYGIFTTIGSVSRKFEATFWKQPYHYDSIWNLGYDLGGDPYYFSVNLLLNVLICAAATVLMFRMFSCKHTEKVEDVSDSWFGYRTLIPVMAVLTISSVSSLSGYMFRLLFIYVAYVIYRKGVHLKRSDAYVIFGYAVLLLLFACLAPGEFSLFGI